MTSGIYKIINTVNGKFYIGGSKNIEKRWLRHLNELSKGKHHNCRMQEDFNLHGRDSFVLQVILEKEGSLKPIEDKFIREMNAKGEGYNIGDANFGDTLTAHPNREERLSKISKTLKETLSKMSDDEKISKYGRYGEENGNYRHGIAHECKICSSKLSSSSIHKRVDICGKCRDRSGKNNPFYGKTHTEATKEKIRLRSLGRRCKSVCKKVLAEGLEFEAAIDCAKHFNISQALVTYRVKSPKYPNWVYLE